MSKTTPKTVEQCTAELRAQPGIRPSKLQPGDRIILETTQGILELKINRPESGLMWVNGTNFRNATFGQFLHSDYDLEGKVRLVDWIGKSLRMHIRFANTIFVCTPAISASVHGSGWNYDVF